MLALMKKNGYVFLLVSIKRNKKAQPLTYDMFSLIELYGRNKEKCYSYSVSKLYSFSCDIQYCLADRT